MVMVGEPAPDFILKDQSDKEVRMSDFRGKKVLLAFYVADWSPVCEPEMKCLHDDIGKLKEYGIEVIGISVDSLWSHKAWANHMGVDFSLLSDFSKNVTKNYGLLRPEGFSERAYILVDENGIIRWKHVMPVPGQRLENEEILKHIENMK